MNIDSHIKHWAKIALKESIEDGITIDDEIKAAYDEGHPFTEETIKKSVIDMLEKVGCEIIDIDNDTVTVNDKYDNTITFETVEDVEEFCGNNGKMNENVGPDDQIDAVMDTDRGEEEMGLEDEYKRTGTLADDKDLKRDIEQSSRKYEQSKGGLTEAEEEDDDYDDSWKNSEEWKSVEDAMKKFDALINKKDPMEDPEYLRIHNRMTELRNAGLDKSENKKEYKSLLSQLQKLMGGESSKEDDGDKKYFVTGRVYIAEPQDTKEEVDKQLSKDAKDYPEFKDNIVNGLKGTKIIRNDHFIKEFPDEKSAAKFVYDSIGELKKEYDLDYSKFKRLQDKEMIKGYGEVNAIPQIVKKVDPNAFGFEYDSTKGKDRVYGMGPKKDKEGNDLGSFNKIDEILFIEFIVYKAEVPLPYDGGYDQLLDAWAEENIEGYTEYKAKQKEEARRKYEEERAEINAAVEEIDQDQRDEYIKTINSQFTKMLNAGDENEIDKILKPIFPDMTREQRISEVGPEELGELSRGKLWRILKRLDGYLAKKFAEKQTKSGEEEKLATDDEILAAAASEENGEEDNKSVDGYATRGDETKGSATTRKDAEEDEEAREREEKQDKKADDFESDVNDYEKEQDYAGGDDEGSFSSLRGAGKSGNPLLDKEAPEIKEDPYPLSIKGVKCNREEMGEFFKLPKDKRPKTEAEVKKFLGMLRNKKK